MHAAEREQRILELLRERGFVAFQQLDESLSASPATLRRDLDKLEGSGRIVRVRGGAKLASSEPGDQPHLAGVPFHQNIERHRVAKEAIGRAAAALCRPRESTIIDGGSTTLQMCPHLATLQLQVLSNSLHIINALLAQPQTRVTIPAGTVFREQNIVLSPFADDGMSRYRAARMFMGAAAVGRHGVMQADLVLAQAEQRLIDRADELVLLVDSSKFHAPAGHVVCELAEIDVVVTDDGIAREHLRMLERAGVDVVVAQTRLKAPRAARSAAAARRSR
jgi:DeoR family ulaG and ulaABCDEF operon transcriptional repressor